MALDDDLARSYWHLVAHRSEVAGDRDFVRLDWPLGELVLYNDKGTIIAFDNVCPHRGARFFLDDRGNAPALCAYHGWSYRGGKLRIPKPDTYRPCDLAAARLHDYQIAYCGDFLFAAVSPRTTLTAQLGGLAPMLAAMSADIERLRDVNAYTYECSWRVAVENALEPDHVNMVHPNSLGLLDLDPGVNSFHARNSVLRATIRNARMSRRLTSMGRFFDVSAAEPGYIAIYLFPFAFLTSTFGYSYALQTFLPSRASLKTHFTSRLLTARLASPEMEPIVAPFFDSVAAVNRQVFAEDHEICRRVDPHFNLDGSDRIFSSTEEKVRHFRDSLASAFDPHNPFENVAGTGSALAADAGGFGQQRTDIDWRISRNEPGVIRPI